MTRDPLAYSKARPGYTLPVFACAAAIAALRRIHQVTSPISSVLVDLVEPSETVEIPIEQSASLRADAALAIAYSDPGDNLDLTRDTPIWALVEFGLPEQTEAITLQGGEGIGRHDQNDKPAIYAYARRLLHENLSRELEPGEKIRVTIILPEGRALAERTSNAAFGVVEGLSLLGTSGISQPLSAPDQLAVYRETLRQRAEYDCLVFCVGENGLDLAKQMGVQGDRLLKTANWLGPMLVEAGLQGIQKILLFGYHGKLIKLAGGIFHTHHHVADGRQEIFAAHAANQGLPTTDVQLVFKSPTAEAALQHLRHLDSTTGSCWVEQIYGAIAQQIDQRSHTYIHAHSDRRVQVGSILFDRDRQIIVQSKIGSTFLTQVC
ncbi:cobalt-precorrin-5B (C(1))-methyltransferase [Oculatella sp. FACHB-28]|uniref:cobalt-precorrin-5B (C(1))-methyltransferase CbiD n=1 Tax=Oculatella sp. FACHB-28 TaxID=2692845 RepID=UPI0016881D45|nr:cobalt-precorrin-5B (C(1))-methyltransferase CbiD [Oculatella sp. FACHB-28]MBD2057755.1 cobalt-precorrin-5B (C(1))-methyltransferase [Oculatella sp. FACHB-28]